MPNIQLHSWTGHTRRATPTSPREYDMWNRHNTKVPGMIAAVTNHILMDRVREFLATEQGLELFNERFSRCRTLLESTASRMLSCPEKVELVVYNCWLAGFRNPPTFDTEGEFRRWLFRLLISEAQAILHQNHLSSTASHQPNAFAQPGATVEQQRGLQNASR